MSRVIIIFNRFTKLIKAIKMRVFRKKEKKMKNQKKRYLVCIGVIVLLSFAILASCVSSLEQVDTADLHVASPDWREQILYFILTDRFNDGNPKNSNQKKGEYDPLSEAKYQGGDLQGIIDKIDYIKGLGATAIWITPPVANQWWDPMVNYGGYHGYWAENLVKVDKHLGTLNDYKRLSATLHQNGMYLVQDIVPNHMGNYFRITEIAGAPKFFLNKDSVPIKAPTQKPFNMVDMNNPKHKEADIYHWTGNISDENSDYIRHNYQLSDLDDLNTENPAVIEALKESYGYWIQEVGVDGFRVDTAKYVPMEFWRDFFHGDNGILEQARKTGREDFTAFGEAWFGSTPFSDTADRAIASYRGREDNPGFPGMLNFSLHSEINEVFARGKSTDRMEYRLASLKKQFNDLSVLYNFIDNHDMERFLSFASVEDLELALLFMYTIPGVPIVYYGTEQGFTGTRHSMFAGGWGSGGVDHFDTESHLYKYLADIARLRLSSKTFTRGAIDVVGVTNQGPGVFAYTLSFEGKKHLIVINTSTNAFLAGNIALGEAMIELNPLFSIRSEKNIEKTDSEGLFSLLLQAKSAVVYEIRESKEPKVKEKAALDLSGPEGIWKTARRVQGSTGDLETAKIIIDGNWAKGIAVSGEFSLDLSIDGLGKGQHNAVLAGFDSAGNLVVSSMYEFEVELDFQKVLSISDPVGDDLGPEGKYAYPTDFTFDDKQCDLIQMDVFTAGTNLQLSFETNAPISTSWAPQYGFDHLAFYIYIQLPDSKSTVNVMPNQNAFLPDAMTWDYFSQIGGWTNFYYNSKDASSDTPGTAMVPGPEISIDTKNNKIIFTWSGESFNFPKTLSGAKIYVATYDYDGMSNANRAMKMEAGEWNFSGGDGKSDPLIMDWIGPVVIP